MYLSVGDRILGRYLIDCSLVEMQLIEKWYKELFNTEGRRAGSVTRRNGKDGRKNHRDNG